MKKITFYIYSTIFIFLVVSFASSICMGDLLVQSKEYTPSQNLAIEQGRFEDAIKSINLMNLNVSKEYTPSQNLAIEEGRDPHLTPSQRLATEEKNC